jgi:hypothetical protein
MAQFGRATRRGSGQRRQRRSSGRSDSVPGYRDYSPTLLETLIRQGLAGGEGFALLGPHGDLVERIVRAVPATREPDLVYFNVPDTRAPLGFNPLASVVPAKGALAASGIWPVVTSQLRRRCGSHSGRQAASDAGRRRRSRGAIVPSLGHGRSEVQSARGTVMSDANGTSPAHGGQRAGGSRAQRQCHPANPVNVPTTVPCARIALS